MAGPSPLLLGLALVVLPIAGCTYFQSDNGPPEGTWTCTSEWFDERDAASGPRSVVQQSTCKDNVMAVTGMTSIGTAQWSEKKEGTCYSSGEELYGTWTSVQTVPNNAAARKFEKERLGGQSLAIATKAVEQEYRVRLTSRTDTQLKAVNAGGQVISCSRL